MPGFLLDPGPCAWAMPHARASTCLPDSGIYTRIKTCSQQACHITELGEQACSVS